jgi:hypothetical protein
MMEMENIIDEVQKRQLMWFGHTNRMEETRDGQGRYQNGYHRRNLNEAVSTSPNKYLLRHLKLVFISATYHTVTCSNNGSDMNQSVQKTATNIDAKG